MNKKLLSPNVQEFVLRWGEGATHWGLNRTEAQIHALLLMSPEPLDAEEIAGALNIARSNASTSLHELQNWGIVRTVPLQGERREHFEAIKDVWEMFRRVVDEQKRREIDPVLRMLKDTSDRMDADKSEHPENRERIKDLTEFFEIMTTWYDQVRGLPLPVVKGFLKLGGKAVKTVADKG